MSKRRSGRQGRVRDPYGEPLDSQLAIRISRRMAEDLETVAQVERVDRADLVREAVYQLLESRLGDPQWRTDVLEVELARLHRVARRRRP